MFENNSLIKIQYRLSQFQEFKTGLSFYRVRIEENGEGENTSFNLWNLRLKYSYYFIIQMAVPLNYMINPDYILIKLKIELLGPDNHIRFF